MVCNGCKFFKTSESNLFKEISVYCDKYNKHLAFITRITNIETPNFCEVDKDER